MDRVTLGVRTNRKDLMMEIPRVAAVPPTGEASSLENAGLCNFSYTYICVGSILARHAQTRPWCRFPMYIEISSNLGRGTLYGLGRHHTVVVSWCRGGTITSNQHPLQLWIDLGRKRQQPQDANNFL